MADDEIKLEALMARQKEMAEIAERLSGETDVERIQQVAAELQVMATELQEMGEKLAAQSSGGLANNWTEVVLTDKQRARIEASTGVVMQTIKLRDPSGVTTRTMPFTDPRIIEYYAMEEARRKKVAEEADEQLQAQLAESIAAIESQGTPALLEQLEQLKADPKFLGGLLQKKSE